MSGKWSAEEVALAFKLKNANYRMREILAHFPGRTISALESKFRRELNPARKQPATWRKTVGVQSFKVPPDVWADRDRRLNEPQTLTEQFFNDPAPSRSALGRPCE